MCFPGVFVALMCYYNYFCIKFQDNQFKFSGMKKYHRSIVGRSYAHRVKEILRIYDEHSRSGLSNREILRRYIWPLYPICEKTFYNIINASADPRIIRQQEELDRQLSLF
jgi:hypothetical protein|nr:MAG TPA: hypothetical protein [Caudoviricetes sp.]